MQITDELNEVMQYLNFDPKTGAITPKLWRREIMPFALYFDPQFTNGVFLVNAAPAPTAPAHYKLPHQSAERRGAHPYHQYMIQSQSKSAYPLGLQADDHFGTVNDPNSDLGNPLLGKYWLCRENLQAGNLPNYTILLQDMGDKTQFMNQPVHMQLFAGSSQLPGEMAEPMFLPTRHSLRATFQNLGIAAAMRTFLCGEMFYPWAQSLVQYPNDRSIMLNLINRYMMRRKYVYPFWLTTEAQIVLNNQQSQDYDALVGDDAHFEATHVLSLSTAGVPYEFEILDPDTNQTISNGRFDGEAATGSAQLPQELKVPWVVPAGRRLQFRVKNKGSAANTIWVALRGRKIRAPFREWKDMQNDLATPTNPKPSEARK